MASNFHGHGNQGVQVGNSSGTITQTIHVHSQTAASPDYNLGLSLSGAPQIDDELFVGRETEEAQLERYLLHTPTKQNIVALWGLGGIGKTQLSIHFAKQHQDQYTSIIWLNAKDQDTLKTGFVALASRLLGREERKAVLNQEEDQAVRYTRQWLSETENKKWLVIFDNYDDPRLPGIQSTTGYDIRDFFPFQAQGSILITTRSSRIKFGKQVRLSKLENLHQSLAILANQSGRDAESDVDAHKLAKRLDGLPLALTTAGAYINQTAETFGSYLRMYNTSWNDLAQNSDELLEYEDRTLYSTWNLSLKQVEAQDLEAGQLLRLMAYLSNLDLWFELFQKGSKSGPAWLSNLVKSKARFNKAIVKLQEYSLVEANIEAQSSWYSLHTCVHDWTLECLNRELNDELYQLAVHCIAANVMLDSERDFWVVNRRLIQHVSRLEKERIERSVTWNQVEVGDVYGIAYLNATVGRTVEAVKMYQRALDGKEKAWGLEHTSTLDTVNNLGVLYKNQGRMAEAEAMYQRALDGKEKAWGLEHTSTLDTVNNLGMLYADQGRMAEAEAMYQRALDGKEKAWGLEHTSTLDTVNNLGVLYADQGRMAEAEAMYQRALDGKEKAWGPEHTSTLDTVNNLGVLYADQGRMAEAEAMYQRALDGKEKAWGPEHTSTLDTVNNLGVLYKNQGRMAEAEAMYQRALDGYEKLWGLEHTSTLDTVNNLGVLYADQGRMAEAEAMYQRALDGKEKAWGLEHTSTLDTVNNLGVLYADQGRMAEAEAMYQRALDGKEKAWGPEHTSTLDTVNNLGVLYADQGRMAEAEAMYQRALDGYEKLRGSEYQKTIIVKRNLQLLKEK